MKNPVTMEALLNGGYVLVDKPLHWTSFDVVNKLRYAMRSKLGRKKYKVGHAGTLDPLATGLLIICYSSFTKKIEQYTNMGKAYSGTIELGVETPSYDAETFPSCYYPDIKYTQEALESTVAALSGSIKQVPPMYSAIKSKGVALYKLARQGKVIARKERDVTISQFDIKAEIPNIHFNISCTKGTYIRTIAHDFGKLLNSGGYLTGLRRTKIGEYDVQNAWQIEELVEAIAKLKA